MHHFNQDNICVPPVAKKMPISQSVTWHRGKIPCTLLRRDFLFPRVVGLRSAALHVHNFYQHPTTGRLPRKKESSVSTFSRLAVDDAVLIRARPSPPERVPQGVRVDESDRLAHRVQRQLGGNGLKGQSKEARGEWNKTRATQVKIHS